MSLTSASQVSRRSPPISRSRLISITSLMLLSTLLFVIGVALERGWFTTSAGADVHQETAESAEAHEEGEVAGGEAQDHEETEAPHIEEEADTTLLGIDLESPGVIVAVVVGTLLLMAAIFVFGYPALLVVLIVSIVGVIFDLRELNHQLAEGRSGIAALAAGVALTRVVTAVLVILALRERRALPAPGVSSPSTLS